MSTWRQKMLEIWGALCAFSALCRLSCGSCSKTGPSGLPSIKYLWLYNYLLLRSIGKIYPLVFAKYFKIPNGMRSINLKYALFIHFLKLSSDLRSKRLSCKQNAAKMNKLIFMLFTRPNTLGNFFFCWIFGFFKVQLIQISQKSDYKPRCMS